MKRLNELFKCPQCFQHRLEEVQINVTVTTVVEMLGEGGDTHYGEQSHEDGTTERFQCIDCGWAISVRVDATDVFFLVPVSCQIVSAVVCNRA